MTTTTLAIVNEPTMADGLATFLNIALSLRDAGNHAGVTIYRDEDENVLEVETDPELPAGVLEYVLRVPVTDPWPSPIWRRTIDTEAVRARRELVEVLARVNPSRDVLATAETVGYL